MSFCSRQKQLRNQFPHLLIVYPDLSVEEAYQVQLRAIEQKVQEGQRIVGKKIGLTSVAMQELLGVDQPDYGHLLDSMEISNNGMISLDHLFQPKIEGEIAFVLSKDLKWAVCYGRGCTRCNRLHSPCLRNCRQPDYRLEDYLSRYGSR